VVYRRREFTEAWAHEASIVPVATWPLLRHRRETHIARPWGFDQIMARHNEYVDTAVGEIRRRGPLGASDLPDPSHAARRMPGTWYGSVPRAVLEACFGRGQLAVTARRDNFSRVFDLAERVIPAEHHDRVVDRHDGQRELLMLAARACGVATAADLADYFRMRVGEARPRIGELVDAGRLEAIGVDGWREPAYALPGAVAPKVVAAQALLSPFDPLIWFRPRTARLFEFNYRFEIFIPGNQRKWGSYVLPFVFGDRLAARVDVKADRGHGRLLVPGAFLESWADAGPVAEALALELRALSTWLGLDAIHVGRRGNLAAALKTAVRARTGRDLHRQRQRRN